MAGLKDITGQQFARLTVVRFHSLNRAKQAMWECRCSCGTTCVIHGAKLRNGHTKSCGCLHSECAAQRQLKHSMSDTPTHVVWMGMRGRCENPNNPKYHRYGGRGIKVCERWQTFANFYADMGERPKGKTIDRIDNDGNYDPDNCRWATPLEQGNNTSTNRLLTAHGRTMNLKQWAAFLGRNRSTLAKRLEVMRVEDALTPRDMRKRLSSATV